MTREQTVLIIRSMMSAYPNYKPENITDTVNVWSALLKDYEYEKISEALKRYILTDHSGFAPSIGQITSFIADEETETMTPLEAWSLVHKAIKNSGYHSEEEFAKLPYACQKAVGSAFNLRELGQMDSEVVNSVEQSHFIKAYTSVVEREKKDKQLPENMRTLVTEVAQQLIEDKEMPKREFTKPKTWEERKADFYRALGKETK